MGLEQVLANQEGLAQSLDRLEAGMAEVLARMRGQVGEEEEEDDEE